MVRRFLWVIVVVILLVAAVPVWFPWVLTPVLDHFHLAYAGYERLGYTRFALGGVKAEWKRCELKAKRIECVLPTTWIWKKLTGGTSDSPYLILANGELVITNQTTAATAPGTRPSSQSSFNKSVNQTVRFARTLQRFAPAAQLTNCTIQMASNKVIVPYALWRDGNLQAAVKLPQLNGVIELAGRLQGRSSFDVSARWDAYNASVEGELSRTVEGWRLKGDADWFTNHASLTAQFVSNGWWPSHARLNCPVLAVPGDLIHLRGYKDLNAALTVDLSSNQFNLQTTGFARPTSDLAARGFRPVSFSVVANGNPDVVNLQKLHVQSPWLKADLTNSMGMTWQGELLAEPALLHVQADLGKMPGSQLSGQANADVRVVPHGRRPPTAQFSCLATNLVAGAMNAERVLLHGEYAASKLRLEEFTADLPDNSKLAASGSFDFQTQQIGDGRWKISGTYLKKFLPAVNFDALTASGELSGPLTNCSHRGELAIKAVRGFHLKPLNANAQWRGQNFRLDSVAIDLAAGESTLSVGGAVDLSAAAQHEVSAAVTNVTLRRADHLLYALQRPCTISFRAGATNAAQRNWTLAVDGFDWKGANGGISLATDLSWPTKGRVTATMTNVALGDFSDFFTNDLSKLSLAAFAADAHWSNGPIHSVVGMAGTMTNRFGQSFALHCALATDEALSVGRLSLANGLTPTLSVTGSVPVKIIPGSSNRWVVWNSSQAIALTGKWVDEPGRPFTLPIGAQGRITVAKPDLHFQISGTAEGPSVSVTAKASAITWQHAVSNSPQTKVEDIHLGFEVHPERITLADFRAKVDGQAVHAAGEMPLSTDDWRAFWSRGKLPDWGEAQGRFRMDGARVAAVARYLPQFLAPEGRVSVNLKLKTGKQIEGSLSLTNAATRSLANLTPVRDIAAEVRFAGQRAELQSFSGQIGGQPVRADAFVTVTNGALDYQVHVTGTNVPLARGLELLLRGDFDVRLRGGSNMPPVLSGGVNLHHGLFVQHAAALVWSKPKRPELRPPYFSVTNEPFADWKLNLVIAGNRFLRVRTPFFNGVLAANLKVTGLLRRPVLTGDLRVDSGRISFPFGTLDVNQGLASFTGNDLRGPDLQITASDRNYGYDIRLEISGPASTANVTFSSTPPLTSEQILLMLTAGEIPQTEFAYSNQARVGRLATFLGKDLLSRFLGTGPSEEHLIIRTGESISEEGRLTYAVEYRITDWLSIIGEYDEFNAFNVDLKWTIFTR